MSLQQPRLPQLAPSPHLPPFPHLAPFPHLTPTPHLAPSPHLLSSTRSLSSPRYVSSPRSLPSPRSLSSSLFLLSWDGTESELLEEEAEMNQGARDAGKMSNLRRRRRTFSRSGPEHLKPSGPYGADSEQHREGPVGKAFFLFFMSPPRSDTGFRGSLVMGANHFFCTFFCNTAVFFAPPFFIFFNCSSLTTLFEYITKGTLRSADYAQLSSVYTAHTAHMSAHFSALIIRFEPQHILVALFKKKKILLLRLRLPILCRWRTSK